MSKQSEAILEEQLVAQLKMLGYQYALINSEKDLVLNLKAQLEKHNNITFSANEFEKVLNILSKGSVFEKAKTLRQKQHIIRDNGDNLYFEFLKTDNNGWCQNQFQVTNQVSIDGKYKNRYDVTILINGLPLVQIELKRSGLEMKEAFNQINRYQRHSFGANSALYQYVQIFIISNGVNTKYYANNRFQSFKQTFYWTDINNKRLTNILNGFIWHTTGSGKTFTSFKASQILMKMPEVDKVVFVVDRKDLDYQTTKEFNSFSDGCIDGTDNTNNLVKQFIGTYVDKKGEAKNSKLIVTTIQKLNTAPIGTHLVQN